MGHYTHLSKQDRLKLACFREMGLSIREIAKRLGRHHSTIYRELSRNHSQGYYFPFSAHLKAQTRRPGKPLKMQTDKKLYHYVYDRLKQGWSPEQIVGRMRLLKQPFDICHETIYQYVYQHGQKKLWLYLPTQRKKRRKRRARSVSKCRYGEIRLITQRPKYIEHRSSMGHWEGDLIEFQGTKKKTVTTLVERKARVVILLKNTTKTSRIVMNKIKDTFNKKPTVVCKTLTFDQGVEFADYRCIESASQCKVYYCEAHSPWQKGSNENMNGRLRRYLPSTTDIDCLTQEELDQLADKMNTVPRKCLGFKTPKELYLQHIRNACRTRT